MRFVLVHDANNPNRNTDRYQIIRSFHENVHQAIQKTLEDAGHLVFPIYLDHNLKEKIQKNQPDFAFNCSIKSLQATGAASAPQIMQELGIPFTGSDAQACNIAFNKNRSKQVLNAAGIATPRSYLVRDPDDFQLPYTLAFPLFLKPYKGGCSYGIDQANLVMEKANLRKKLADVYRKVRQPVLLEEFVGGREFTVGILDNDPAQVLPIMEFRYQKDNKRPFRSFSLKMVDYADEDCLCPAALIEEKQAELEALALRAYHAVGCRDYARVDLRMDRKGRPYVLEINALPNLMPETSSYAIMARKAGLTFSELIQRILQTAARRYGMRIS